MMLAGMCNACMDTRFMWNDSIFHNLNSWFNPLLSQKNKWKNGDRKNGERFFGSSTFLVWLTDFWHFMKMLMLIFLSFSIVSYQTIYNWYIDTAIMYLAFTIPFELLLRILIKNK
jgi:hypothetical protein